MGMKSQHPPLLRQKSDENAPPKQAVIPHAMVQGKLAQNNKSAEEVCG